MILRQYELKNGNQSIVCWLEDGRCEVDDFVTLKDTAEPELLWKVVASYSASEKGAMTDEHEARKVFGSIQGRSGN